MNTQLPWRHSAWPNRTGSTRFSRQVQQGIAITDRHKKTRAEIAVGSCCAEIYTCPRVCARAVRWPDKPRLSPGFGALHQDRNTRHAQNVALASEDNSSRIAGAEAAKCADGTDGADAPDGRADVFA